MFSFDKSFTSKPIARFVSDITLSDGSVVAPSSMLIKTWRLTNPSANVWPTGVFLMSVDDPNSHISSFDQVYSL